jgi:hypothetical protein
MAIGCRMVVWQRGLMWFVQVDEEQRTMNYSQTFQLLPDGQGSYFIFNDIFKLVFG